VLESLVGLEPAVRELDSAVALSPLVLALAGLELVVRERDCLVALPPVPESLGELESAVRELNSAVAALLLGLEPLAGLELAVLEPD
jgi:hypothetical protein